MSGRSYRVIDPSTIISTAELGGVLVLVRLALPAALTWIANRLGKRLPGYQFEVGRVDIKFARPCVTLHQVHVDRVYSGAARNLANINSVRLETDWNKLLNGDVCLAMLVDQPRVTVDLREFPQAEKPATNDKRQSPRAGKPTPKTPSWRERIKELPNITLLRAMVEHGDLRVSAIPDMEGVELHVANLNASIENLTNNPRAVENALAQAVCTADVMDTGDLAVHLEGYPLVYPPVFDADLIVKQIDLVPLRSLLAKYVPVDILNGVADLFVEAGAAHGNLKGYAKPVLDHVRVEPLKDAGFGRKVKGGVLTAASWIGRNRTEDRIATRIDFHGAYYDPRWRITLAVERFFRNAFFRAERSLLEKRVWLSHSGPSARDADVQFVGERKSRLSETMRLTKAALYRWLADNTMQNAAALAYYTAFSIAPLLLLAIGVAGFVLGPVNVQNKIIEQVSSLVGRQSADMVRSMIVAIARPSKGVAATFVSIISILLGATGVLGSMKTSLNEIWRTQEEGDFKDIVKQNARFLGMILGIGFLLVVSLLISTAIAALGNYLLTISAKLEFVLQVASFCLSLAIETVLFGSIYKLLPNFDVHWSEVWIGAFVAALLFSLGKILLSYYLGRSAISSYYGAASSVLILLLWIYYSGLILYFGAELAAVSSGRLEPRNPPPSARPRY